MASISSHRPLSYFHFHHPFRFVVVALLVLVAYLLISKTAAGQSEGVLILSSDFELKQYTAHGSLEAKPQESEDASRNLRQALTTAADAHPDLQAVAMPQLDASEQAMVDEHVALLSTIIDNIRFMEERAAGAYARKSALGPASISSRDYAIGTGLDFLAERTGARQALIVAGWHVAPTGGRVALGVLLYGMPPPEAGMLSVAMADLRTGRVSWFGSSQEVYDGVSYALLGHGKSVDDKIVTDPVLAEAMFRDMLASYHGRADPP